MRQTVRENATIPVPPRAGARGTIFVPAIVLVVTLTMLALLLMETSAEVTTRVERAAEGTRLEAIADAAVGLAMHGLWQRYEASVGEDRKLATLRQFLDGASIPAQARLEGSVGTFDIFGHIDLPPEAWSDILPDAGLPSNARGSRALDGAYVLAVDVLRQDASQVTALRARATVSFGPDARRQERREVERVYLVGGEKFHGLEFALLANNVNCIMCHATVDAADRYYNTDPALYGTYERVRVGTLESLKIRANSADSQVYGAIYTRGPVMDKDGTLLTDLTRSSLNSVLFDGEGKVLQSATGATTSTSLVNTFGDPLPQWGNLYLNYPRDHEKQTDGPFPEEFPPVIPDVNGNRQVDDEEFASWQDEARGRLTGGRKVLVPRGGTYAQAGLPAGDLAPVLEGAVDGNVVLVGTSADPLVIDGRVAVNGDVVLYGTVRGAGEVVARGSVYVVGDLVYADAYSGANRTFGVAADGTPNRLTLAAGGNICLGDFLRGKGGGDPISGDRSGDFNFTLSEVLLFNQMEWTRAQPSIAGPPPKKGEVGVSLPNPLYAPDHRPRYYVIHESNPVAIFNKGDTYWNPATATWLGKEHLGGWSDGSTTYLPVGDPQREDATVLPLMPAGAWLSGPQLLAMLDAAAAGHGGGPLAIDAFLYTNNAIFLVTSKSSVYGGRALVNGGLVGADLGILVAGGLQLNFDRRHDGVLNLRETRKGELELVRGVRLR